LTDYFLSQSSEARMTELGDDELQQTGGEPPLRERRRTPPTGVWIAVMLLVIAAGVATYVLLGRQPLPPTPVTSAPITAPRALSPRSLGGDGDRITLPSLANSDPLVRTLVEALSRNAAVTRWLATSGLIRNFVVVVANIADGVTPARHLTVLRPERGFRAIDHGGSEYVDPRSYGRYGRIADAVDSIEPAAAARVYATLKPRIEEAYHDLGYPDVEFDRALERALKVLIATPIVQDPIRVRRQGIGYAYADDRLEDLPDPQKQLLRMGPAHVQRIEEALRRLAAALGIPGNELAPLRQAVPIRPR